MSKHFGLHVDDELHYQIHYIAKYEGRSASGQILYLLRQYVREFEKEHGYIDLPDDEEE